MLELNFSKVILDQLHYERFNNPHPRVQLKMEAIYLKGIGMPNKKILEICRISKTTFTRYQHVFIDEGVEGLKVWNCKGRKGTLNNFCCSFKDYFTKNPPQSIAVAIAFIKKKTGKKFSASRVRTFLKELGFKYLKAGHVPANACSEEKQKEQESFKNNELEPCLTEARCGKREVFFWMPPILYTEHFSE